jgi:hypothetical protein
MKNIAIVVLALLIAGVVGAQTVANRGTVQTWTITNYPRQGVAVAEHDTNAVDPPMAIRADTAGAVTARCVDSASNITLNLVAGEFFPCQVDLLLDTGTDAIAFHGFY